MTQSAPAPGLRALVFGTTGQLGIELARRAPAGVAVTAASPPVLPVDAAQLWWQRFEHQVRGRGRGVEQLADWLDIVFGLAFVLCAWLLWRSMRSESGSTAGGG